MKNSIKLLMLSVTMVAAPLCAQMGTSVGKSLSLAEQLFNVVASVNQTHESQKNAVKAAAGILAQSLSSQVRDENGRTALMLAVQAHSFPLVYLFLNYRFGYGYAKNVSIDIQNQNNKKLVEDLSQPMNEAKKLNLISTTNKTYKQLVNAQDSNGMTALMFAALAGHKTIVKLLLAAGADKNIKNKEGKTAAQLAEDNNIAMLDILNGRDIVHNNQGIETVGTSGLSTLDSSHGFPQVSHTAVPMINER